MVAMVWLLSGMVRTLRSRNKRILTVLCTKIYNNAINQIKLLYINTMTCIVMYLIVVTPMKSMNNSIAWIRVTLSKKTNKKEANFKATKANTFRSLEAQIIRFWRQYNKAFSCQSLYWSNNIGPTKLSLVTCTWNRLSNNDEKAQGKWKQ